MKAFEFKDCSIRDFDELYPLFKKLWKNSSRDEIKNLLTTYASTGKQKLMLCRTRGNSCVAFAFFSIRTDYVEGARQSPTGYLEGIFVDEEFRNKGIARHLILLGTEWVKKNGCVQMGSDTWLSDATSRQFHKRLGFREEDELVHFLKDI